MTDEKKEPLKGETPPPQPPGEPPAAEEAVDVEALKAKAAERDEFLDLAQRARAELINYRKRIERERAEWTDRAVAEFALKLLPALDDFDRALREAEAAADAKALLAGFRQIDRKFHDVLKAAGLEPFSPHGKPFDAAEHEAVLVEESDKHPHHAVSDVVRKGWRLRGRVLRPAQVKVARKPEPQAAGDAGPEEPEELKEPEKPKEPKQPKEPENDANV